MVFFCVGKFWWYAFDIFLGIKVKANIIVCQVISFDQEYCKNCKSDISALKLKKKIFEIFDVLKFQNNFVAVTGNCGAFWLILKQE